MSENRTIVIATGGTGGHVFPAQAVTDELFVKKYSIHLITDKRGLKYLGGAFNEVQKTIIISTNFNQKLSNKLLNFTLLILSSLKIMWKFFLKKPKMVISFGGYPTFPAALYAIIFRIPLILHEQNSVLGQINKLFLPFAKKLLISFPDTKNINKKYNNKVSLTGLPVRNKFIKEFNNKKRKGSKNLKILVTGGSQGARLFSHVIPQAIQNLDKALQEKIQITQQVRKENLSEVTDIYKKTSSKYNIKTFFENINELYSQHNLVISRAGASSIVELMMFEKAAILVPFAKAKDNHQFYNAKFLSKNSKIILKEEDQFSSKWLSIFINNILGNFDNIQDIQKSYNNKYRELHLNAVSKFIKEINNT